jgi:hypothetical protein
MKIKLAIPYFFIPLAYLLLVGGFIHLQTSGNRQSFSFQTGSVSVSGNRSAGRTAATLKFYGRSVELHEALWGISVDAEDDGSREPLVLEEVTGDQQNITALFRDGVSLEISSETISLLIAPESPFSGIGIESGPGAWETAPVGYLPAVLIEQKDGTRMIDLKRSRITDEGSILMTGSGAKLSFAFPGGEDPVRYWFFRGDAPVAVSRYESSMREYLELAYRGWKSGRYNAGSDTWTLPDGSRQFQEAAMVGMVAEGFRRRDTVDLNAVKGMSSRHEENITALAAPYVGLLVLTDEQRRERGEETARRIREQVQAGDPALFSEVNHLVEFLLFSGDSRLVSEVASFIAEANLEEKEMNGRQLAGLVEFYVDAGNLYPERFAGYEKLYALIDSMLLPRMGRMDGGLFLFDDDSVDLMASLKAGYYLQEIGRGESRTLLEEIGRTMVVSALSLADDAGYLPAGLSSTAGQEGGSRSGFILPEDVYPLLAENRYYPQPVFLYKELGSEVSLWTVAQNISASRGNDAYTISFSFSAGATHHMVIRNVPPFAYLELYGIRWNGTRQFQYYDAGGWYYDRASQTLFLKVRHKRSREEVVIHFTDSEPPAAAAAAAPAVVP